MKTLQNNGQQKEPGKLFSRCSELMWLGGVFFVAAGVALCKKADLGVSMIAAPAFILYDALSPHFAFLSVGTVEYIFQGILLAIMCLVVMRFDLRYLLCALVAVIYGYVLDLWLLIFSFIPEQLPVYGRWLLFLGGDVVTALGVACFFRTYLPLQVYELFVAEVSRRYSFGINKTKYVFDAVCFLLSLVLALTLFGDVSTFEWQNIYFTSFHSIGLGTLVTTVINSPIIAGWGKLLDKRFGFAPLFPKLEKMLSPKR